MTESVKGLMARGFRIYFVLVLLSFTLIILLMNVTRVFAADQPSVSPKPAPAKVEAEPITPILPKQFYQWKVAADTQVKFRGNKMLIQLHF